MQRVRKDQIAFVETLGSTYVRVSAQCTPDGCFGLHKRVDVEDLPALAAKSGGADAAPAAVVREGRGCAGGRAVDSGWYGIVEASKEMTLQGGVGSVVRRGGKRNRRYG